jgi:hypothetical protein
MLYDGPVGRSLVSDDYNHLCAEYRVEARVQAFPNPGDVFKALRLVTFTNFNNDPLTVIQQDRTKKRHFLPAKGTLEVMLLPGESMPTFERGYNG